MSPPRVSGGSSYTTKVSFSDLRSFTLHSFSLLIPVSSLVLFSLKKYAVLTLFSFTATPLF